MALRSRSTLFLFWQLNPLFRYSHHPSLLVSYNSLCFSSSSCNWNSCFKTQRLLYHRGRREEILETTIRRRRRRRPASSEVSAALPPLDLTEDNVRQVLADARTVFAQIFDPSIGITGVAELCEVDGPFVKISLRGRFWHERSLVLARLGNYLKQRIPQDKICMGMIYESLAQEILEVDIEDEKQLDDSPENF